MGIYPIEQCPNCGSKDIKIAQRISGVAELYATLDGEQADNSELHASLRYKNIWKYVRCVDCGKKLFVVDGTPLETL